MHYFGLIGHTCSYKGKGHKYIVEDSLNTSSGCTLMTEVQVSSARDGRGHGGRVIGS